MLNSSVKSAFSLANGAYHPQGNGTFYLMKTLHLFPGTKLLFLLAAFLFLLTSCEKEVVEPAPKPGTVTANAGQDQAVQVGHKVTLDASGSKDDQNKTLSFSWANTKKPAGSNVALTNATQVKPSFVPDVPGDYEWEVTVSSTNGQKKDRVVVTAVSVTTEPSNGIISEDITQFRVLTNRVEDPTMPDYVVTNDIKVMARVAIEPGVIIAFEADKGLEILPQGFLTAKGTAARKILFTGKTKTPGFWKGILFDSNNSLNELNHVEVSYGGSSTMRDMPEGVKTNVGITGTDATAASLRITNSSFTNANGYGMYVLGEIPVFSKNSFSDNSGLAMYVAANQVHRLDAASTFTGTASSKGIGVGGTVHQLTTGVIWPLMQDGTNYVAVHDLNLEGGVTVAPGVTLEFMADKALYVRSSGYLKAKGTADNKITFSGLNKTNGYWKGIMIMSQNQLNELDHVHVEYGGRSELGTMHRVKANVVLWGDFTMIGTSSNLKVTNSLFSHSGGYGMAVQFAGGRLTGFINNSFSHNTGAAMFVTAEEVHKLDADSRLNDNNGINGLETSGIVSHEQAVTWPVFSDGARYHITDDLVFETGVTIQNSRNSHLIFEFAADKALYVQGRGYLNSKGKSDSGMIVFTGKNSTPGFWKGILIDSNNSLNQLDNIKVSYAGGKSLTGLNQKTGLGVRGSVSVTNSLFNHSGGYGIFVKQSASINPDAAAVNQFQNNQQGNFHKE